MVARRFVSRAGKWALSDQVSLTMPSKTVAAYARDDLLEKRRPMMQAWSDFVGAPRGA